MSLEEPDHPVGVTGVVGRPRPARARIIATAYELFSRHGIRAVGVDRIVAESGVAKMTLYRHFPSKEALVLSFLDERERRWTHGWLAPQLERRVAQGTHPLMAIFDAFDEWFRGPDFTGCPFVSTLLEVRDHADPVHQACVRHLGVIRDLLALHVEAAGIEPTLEIAAQVQILAIGAIVSASRGDSDAAAQARSVGAALANRDRR